MQIHQGEAFNLFLVKFFGPKQLLLEVFIWIIKKYHNFAAWIINTNESEG